MANSSVNQTKLSDTFPVWKSIRPFALGGMAGCFATCCIQPIDMVKVRIQLSGEAGAAGSAARGPFAIASSIIKNEGFLSLYKGLSAALLRQLTYGTTRLGLFRTLSNTFGDKDGKTSFGTKISISLVSGGVGALVGTPADAALVRMQADQTLPVEQRRGYKNVGDALLRMWREEGLVGGVFAGASPTITRALALNVGMLATYDGAKEFFSQYTTSPAISTFGGGLVSGFCASAMSLPFDFVKTRLQKQRKLPDGSLPYKGFVDCAIKVTAKEGPLAFYSGFPTYYIRIAPHIMLTWAGLEFLQSSVFLK